MTQEKNTNTKQIYELPSNDISMINFCISSTFLWNLWANKFLIQGEVLNEKLSAPISVHTSKKMKLVKAVALHDRNGDRNTK